MDLGTHCAHVILKKILVTIPPVWDFYFAEFDFGDFIDSNVDWKPYSEIDCSHSSSSPPSS